MKTKRFSSPAEKILSTLENDPDLNMEFCEETARRTSLTSIEDYLKDAGIDFSVPNNILSSNLSDFIHPGYKETDNNDHDIFLGDNILHADIKEINDYLNSHGISYKKEIQEIEKIVNPRAAAGQVIRTPNARSKSRLRRNARVVIRTYSRKIVPGRSIVIYVSALAAITVCLLLGTLLWQVRQINGTVESYINEKLSDQSDRIASIENLLKSDEEKYVIGVPYTTTQDGLRFRAMPGAVRVSRSMALIMSNIPIYENVPAILQQDRPIQGEKSETSPISKSSFIVGGSGAKGDIHQINFELPCAEREDVWCFGNKYSEIAKFSKEIDRKLSSMLFVRKDVASK